MNDENFSECARIIQKKIDIIINEWNKGEVRNHLNLRNKK